MSTKIYVENVDLYNENIKRDFNIKQEASVVTVKKAIVLPPKKISSKTKSGIYAGGVTNKKFEFLSGMRRHESFHGNYSCLESYVPTNKNLPFIDEDVIFGGMIIKHFGHAILEDFSRLWYVIKNKENKQKIVFVCFQEMCEHHYKLLELMGIPRERILIIKEPTQFRSITIPDETIHSWYGFRSEYNIIYDEIIKNVKPKKYKKIYFTRTKLNDSFDVNEEFFEKFFSKQGYKIISPETLPLEEQISYASGADELACTLGTLSHFGLFMKRGSKLTILSRTKNSNLKPQFIINQARNLSVSYIDAILEILPVEHTCGCCLMYPTKYFVKYMKDNKINFDSEIKKLNRSELIYKYLMNYAKNYSKKDRYFTIQQYDMYDVICKLNKELNDYNVIKEDIFPRGCSYHLKSYWIRKTDELKKLLEEKNGTNAVDFIKGKIKKVLNNKGKKKRAN